MAVRRVTTTETVDDRTASYSAFDQLIYLIFGVIETLLLIRFLFRATGANPGAGVVDFIYGITDMLMAPFKFIFPSANVAGAVFEWSVLVAMAMYALLAWIIMRLIRIAYTAEA